LHTKRHFENIWFENPQYKKAAQFSLCHVMS